MQTPREEVATMTREVHRYSFRPAVPADEIEHTLLLAVLAAEGLHGESRVRMDASYAFDSEKHACVIDSGSDVGRDICRIFTGFAAREFGGESFSVSRVAAGPIVGAENARA
jgi:hypothetical protein